MSHVTTIILIASLEPEGLRELETWACALDEAEGRFTLGEDLTFKNDTCGGTKYPETGVYAAGWNFFPDQEGLVARFKSMPWRHPENVVLVIKPQEGPIRIERPDGVREQA